MDAGSTALRRLSTPRMPPGVAALAPPSTRVSQVSVRCGERRYGQRVADFVSLGAGTPLAQWPTTASSLVTAAASLPCSSPRRSTAPTTSALPSRSSFSPPSTPFTSRGQSFRLSCSASRHDHFPSGDRSTFDIDDLGGQGIIQHDGSFLRESLHSRSIPFHR